MSRTLLVTGAWLLVASVAWAQQEIHRAAQRGDLARVRKLLDQNPQLLEATDRNGRTPLFYAVMFREQGNPFQRIFVRNRRLEVVKELLRRKANVNHRDRHGQTPLVVAVQWENTPAVRALLRAGAKVNVVDRWGDSPVFRAVRRPEILRLLLEAGGDPNVTNRGGWTPLAAACQSLQPKSVELLLKAGAKANQRVQSFSLLHWTLRSTHFGAPKENLKRVVALLLKAGVDPLAEDSRGKTALDLALAQGDPGVIDVLVEHVGKLPEKSPEGEPILLWAAGRGMVSAVKLALKQGSQVNQADQRGHTALYRAIQGGYPQVVKLLLEAGADIHRQYEGGMTLLHLAAATRRSATDSAAPRPGFPGPIRRLPIGPGGPRRPAPGGSRTPGTASPEEDKLAAQLVQLLLEAGAEPNAVDQSGSTPLHVAAWEGKSRTVQALLKAGAKPDATAGRSTPLHKAAWIGSVPVVQALLQAGADPNARDADGQTPLHKAAFRGHVAVVQALLEAKADPAAKDSAGMTPRHLALDQGHEKVARLFQGKRGK